MAKACGRSRSFAPLDAGRFEPERIKSGSSLTHPQTTGRPDVTDVPLRVLVIRCEQVRVAKLFVRMGAYLPTIGVPVLAPRPRGDAGPFFDFDRADNRNFKLKHYRPTASG